MTNSFSLSKLSRLFKSANSGKQVTVDSSGNPVLLETPMPFRNRIINGDMSVNQVYGSTAITPTTTQFVSDQWKFTTSQASKLTFQQVADAPAGLKYSTKITVASQYSPLSSDYFQFRQSLEGQNIIDFQLGTSGAVTLVISQWIKSSVAGTYAVAIRDSATTRSYVGTVNVTTSWQRLSISLQGDASGTWNTDNTSGFDLCFDLGSGTNFNATSNSWQTGNAFRTADSVTFVNQVIGATINITGVQVEKVPAGVSTPTDFEFLPYDTQLKRAQRYLPYFNALNTVSALAISYVSSATGQVSLIPFPIPTRVAPTGVVISSTAHFTVLSGGSSPTAPTTVAFSNASITMAVIVSTVQATTTGFGGQLYLSSIGGYIYFTGAQL